MRTIAAFFLLILFLNSAFVFAQAPDYSQLDPKPFDPKTEPDIDMFIADWRESKPIQTYGSLLERDIFTRCEGDPLRPATKGAVLQYINRFTHAVLQKNKSTTPSTLKEEQIIFYYVSGKGLMKAGGKTAALHDGVGVLMPEGLEFTMMNTGNEPLEMYVIAEPVTPGFKPSKEMIVKDENTLPIGTTKSHWSHILRPLFYRTEALATLTGMSPVWFDPMTLGQPHSHGEGAEEIWFVIEGDVILHLGKELRKLAPGMAYKIPTNGKTPHSNINVSENKQMKLVWFMVVK